MRTILKGFSIFTSVFILCLPFSTFGQVTTFLKDDPAKIDGYRHLFVWIDFSSEKNSVQEETLASPSQATINSILKQFDPKLFDVPQVHFVRTLDDAELKNIEEYPTKTEKIAWLFQDKDKKQ